MLQLLVRIFLLAILVISNFSYAFSQEGHKYSVRGRAVDRDGKPVEGAVIYLDPLPTAHMRFGFTTEADGVFFLEDITSIPRQKRRLYVTGPRPENAAHFITPPFDLLPKLKESKFEGKSVVLKENKELNVGDVQVQVSYSTIKIYIQSENGEPLLTKADEWRGFVCLRILNSKGLPMTEGNLSINNIKKAVNLSESSLAIALPEGVWQIELSVNSFNGPWIKAENQVMVTPESSLQSVIFRIKDE